MSRCQSRSPVSDIPAIPNDHLLYALYYIDADGNPTRLWHTKGANNYDTLVGHIVQSALRYKQLPSKRLTGDIFTSAHLDMNTVLKDEKYLHAAYSVNSIELKALGRHLQLRTYGDAALYRYRAACRGR